MLPQNNIHTHWSFGATGPLRPAKVLFLKTTRQRDNEFFSYEQELQNYGLTESRGRLCPAKV